MTLISPAVLRRKTQGRWNPARYVAFCRYNIGHRKSAYTTNIGSAKCKFFTVGSVQYLILTSINPTHSDFAVRAFAARRSILRQHVESRIQNGNALDCNFRENRVIREGTVYLVLHGSPERARCLFRRKNTISETGMQFITESRVRVAPPVLLGSKPSGFNYTRIWALGLFIGDPVDPWIFHRENYIYYQSLLLWLLLS